MTSIPLRRVFRSVAALFGVGIALAVPPARAQDTATLTTLHSFNGNDGYGPSKPVQASDGNIYGATGDGGIAYVAGTTSFGYGAIYRVTPSGVYTVIYYFTGGDDGMYPDGLMQAADGNFYGATNQGGAGGRGTLFRMTPAGVLTTLYAFTDVRFPSAPLLQGSDGSLYGVTGGNGDYGTVYRYTPAGDLSFVYRFNGYDGQLPTTLVLGNDGNFYGTTQLPSLVQPGGTGFYGTVFRLTPAGQLTTLHGFVNGDDGANPDGLVLGGDGNFYGSCSAGGPNQGKYGTLFRITPTGELTTVHAFAAGSEGENPYRLIAGNDGNIYGVTSNSNSTTTPALATVFRFALDGTFTTLYGAKNSGSIYFGGITQGRDGNLYGTNSLGDYAKGSVFELKVVSHPEFFAGQVPVGNDVSYLGLPGGGYFGYYTFLSDPNYLYHFDLGFEYLFDANDGNGGLYLYDFASGGFFYTSRTLPFPYMWDFNLYSMVYYFPDPSNAGHYNTNGVRYFYKFSTGAIISK